MFWQAFYALAGCVIGAAVLGNYGALIGTVIGKFDTFHFLEVMWTFAGAWLGFKAVNPYHSLINQINDLNQHQKQNLTDEIRRTVGSSSVENLVRYVSQKSSSPTSFDIFLQAMNGNGKQLIFDIIQRYLNNGRPQQQNVNPGLFSRIFS